MKIAIIGPGSVGAFLACEVQEHKTFLLSRPSSVNKTSDMWKGGITYIHENGGKKETARVIDKNLCVLSLDDAEKINPDLLFVTVRADGLNEQLGNTIVRNASPNTSVVILSNGIMPIDQSFDGIKSIENVVRFKQVLEDNNIPHAWGSCVASCRLSHEDATLNVTNGCNGITIYPSANSNTGDFNSIATAVEASGVATRRFSRDQAVRAMFEKLSFTSAALSAIFGFEIKELATNPSARYLLKKAAEIFYNIAEENGVSRLAGKATAGEYADWVIKQNRTLGNNHYAMWNSLSAGKSTEIGVCVEALCGLAQSINVKLFRYASMTIAAMEACMRDTHPDYRNQKICSLNQMNRQILNANKNKPPGEIMRLIATAQKGMVRSRHRPPEPRGQRLVRAHLDKKRIPQA